MTVISGGSHPLDPATATDINVVRSSLNSFFTSMIGTLSQSTDSSEQRQARFLETVHKHAMQLPGIDQPAWVEADDNEAVSA